MRSFKLLHAFVQLILMRLFNLLHASILLLLVNVDGPMLVRHKLFSASLVWFVYFWFVGFDIVELIGLRASWGSNLYVVKSPVRATIERNVDDHHASSFSLFMF